MPFGRPRARSRWCIEVNSGYHRTGVLPAGAVVVGKTAAEAGLDVAGVFPFPGHATGAKPAP
ncbi:hypothetical protein [Streptomyces sp. NPDC086989]|uniref:hypothetical protein n=1 Tax=Streptomyces sp. NPDC086989 TaxID=3365764 RepID=UPI0037F3781E